MSTPGTDETICTGDIEAKLARIRGVADDTTEVAQEAAKPALVAAGVGVVVTVPARPPSRLEEHHRRGPAHLMAGAAAAARSSPSAPRHLPRPAQDFVWIISASRRPLPARDAQRLEGMALRRAAASGLKLLQSVAGRKEDVLDQARPGEH
jgi:hypothetical protein